MEKCKTTFIWQIIWFREQNLHWGIWIEIILIVLIRVDSNRQLFLLYITKRTNIYCWYRGPASKSYDVDNESSMQLALILNFFQHNLHIILSQDERKKNIDDERHLFNGMHRMRECMSKNCLSLGNIPAGCI